MTFRSDECPFYLRKHTSRPRQLMSALCQKRTHAVQQKGSLFALIVSCMRHSTIDRNGFSEPPSVYRRRLRQCQHRARHFHLSNRRSARCSCCRGRRTRSVASISCATLRFRLGYRVIRHNYSRDGDSKRQSISSEPPGTQTAAFCENDICRG
jgi:hypothetical protein